MRLGMIGLGLMGARMVRRLISDGYARMALTATSALKDPELPGNSGRVSDTDKSTWTIHEAVDRPCVHGVHRHQADWRPDSTSQGAP